MLDGLLTLCHEHMLQFELCIFLVATFFAYIKGVNGALKFFRTILCIAGFVVAWKWFCDVKFMYLFVTIVINFAGIILGNALSEQTTFREKRDMMIFQFIVVVGMMFLNRGLAPRVYDYANVLSFVEEYNMACKLRYTGQIDRNAKTPIKVYIMTQESGNNGKSEDRTIEKFSTKDGSYLVILNYDEEGLRSTGYSINVFWWYSLRNLSSFKYNVTKLMQEGELATNLDTIVEYAAATVGCGEMPIIDGDILRAERDMWDYSSDWDDEDYDESYDDGVHWVDDYYRSDGTHVDGYWRTDPDDDLTNNFSYSP